MDFYRIKERIVKNGVMEVYPDFKVGRSTDLMVRSGDFVAIWDEDNKIWSRDEYVVQKLVDAELFSHRDKLKKTFDGQVIVKDMEGFSSNSWSTFRKYMKNISDNVKTLDDNLTFADQPLIKTSYVSKRLPYALAEGSIEAYDELMSVLYDKDERDKIEWSIGAIISGDSREIHKFLVLYGPPGSGKSTVINIFEKLFEGYYSSFEADAITNKNNQFSTSIFNKNQLLAIQHDGDLSNIESNAKLNAITAHEIMTINEKFKSSYDARITAFLVMGTNKPVKITDSKAGIIRRLLDVSPSGNKIPVRKYQALMKQINFELGAIANHCLTKYREMGRYYYDDYIPISMMYETDVFFNFIEDKYLVFYEQDGISLKQAYDLYKDYCEETTIQYKLPRHKFREELKNYFKQFDAVKRIDDIQVRSYYSGFKMEKLTYDGKKKIEKPLALSFDYTDSILDKVLRSKPAQLASKYDTPKVSWDSVTKTLADIDTKKLHYVKPNPNHIVIDFDIKNDNGEKDLTLNMEKAAEFPPTYGELSKSGSGIHLHYIYDGDVERLSRVYSEGIEVKVFTGGASLRRKLTYCNNIPISTINSGLPLKGEKMINFEGVKSERTLRELIVRALNKEIHPGTKSNVDFIDHILSEAYNSGLSYDVTDLRPRIMFFANGSTNQANKALEVVSKMLFKSEDNSEQLNKSLPVKNKDMFDLSKIVFFDVEVYPNLFLVVYKLRGPGHKKISLINPTPQEVEPLLKMMLVGFNCRRYDNHMMYARYLGYSLLELFELSQRIINNSKNAMLSEAYNLSYTDIYDYTKDKQSLKKWEIQLGLEHQEMDLPWDQPVKDEDIPRIEYYCGIDVDATEAVFEHTLEEFIARIIISRISGLTPNHTTQAHAAKIIFGDNKHPQSEFVYTDLSEIFPGYVHEFGVSTYRGEIVSEGGQVYGETGMYANTWLFDIESQHPTSLNELNHFGKYTEKFWDLVLLRFAVKHEDYEQMGVLLDGILLDILKEFPNVTLSLLALALKIVINIVYGMTSAKYDNIFKDPRNIDNIVAKRGALFMIDLKHAVQEQGYTVAHIKTDSIKIPNGDNKIAKFIKDFGKKYGYNFVHEETFEKFVLVNDVVYVGKVGWAEKESKIGTWDAVGAQFNQPYVYKYLFSKEPITFDDLCESKSVTGKSTLYLDFNENLYTQETSMYELIRKLRKTIGRIESEVVLRAALQNNVDESTIASDTELEINKKISKKNRALLEEYKYLSDEQLDIEISKGHNYIFIGKVGLFVPMISGINAAKLVRSSDDEYHSVTGTKDYLWMEAKMVKTLGLEDKIDMSYYSDLVDAAVKNISKHGDISWLLGNDI